eukprot:TRINITY_DN41313_c0_g1_i1.p1 TRINITY_DN41313_c0_g1~~TRINITY_DN41313_c0_g1_i1.p1  ORF type:complete len:654 (-),score=145.94 TRINITY_DN41313_c0_g1_i1:17-1978(-)
MFDWEDLPEESEEVEDLKEEASLEQTGGSLPDKQPGGDAHDCPSISELLQDLDRSILDDCKAQGIPASLDPKVAADVLAQHHEIDRRTTWDLRAEYERLGLPSEKGLKRDAIAKCLKNAAIWQALPLVELRRECRLRSLQVSSLPSERAERRSLVNALMLRDCEERWEIKGVPAKRIGDTMTAMWLLEQFEQLDSMNTADLIDAYSNIGFPEEPGLEKHALLHRIKKFLAWEALPVPELKEECATCSVERDMPGDIDSEENERALLIQRLTVKMCSSAYVAKGIPVHGIDTLDMVLHVSQQFDMFEEMNAEELRTALEDMGLPLPRSKMKEEALKHLKLATIWMVVSMEELAKECSQRGIIVSRRSTTGTEEEQRGELLNLLLFDLCSDFFEDMGVPAKKIKCFEKASQLVMSFSALQNMSSSELKERYTSMGLPAEGLQRSDFQARLKQVQLWLVLPLPDLQKECRMASVNSIGTEKDRADLIGCLMGARWVQSTPRFMFEEAPPPPQHYATHKQGCPPPQYGTNKQGFWYSFESPFGGPQGHNLFGSQPTNPFNPYNQGPPRSGYAGARMGGPGFSQFQIQPDASAQIAAHYRALQLPLNSRADEVKKAYKKFALKYHPDKNQGASKEYAAQQFHKIQEAYEALLEHLKVS